MEGTDAEYMVSDVDVSQWDLWLWLYLAAFVLLCLFVLLLSCWYTEWYLRHGPCAGYSNAQLCERSHRCRPVQLLGTWCLDSVCTHSTPVSDAGTAAAFFHLHVVDEATPQSAKTRWRYVAPPPAYDEALSMRRPGDGETVRFVVGTGSEVYVCEFKPARSGEEEKLCDPPVYCGRMPHVKMDSTMVVADRDLSRTTLPRPDYDATTSLLNSL